MSTHLRDGRPSVRRTKAREAVQEVFSRSSTPLDAASLQRILNEKGISVHQTTIFRILDDFCDRGILVRHEFGEGKGRFERADLPHHHHAVCTKCGRIFELFECTLPHYLHVPEGFQVSSHRVDIFGKCHWCAAAKNSS